MQIAALRALEFDRIVSAVRGLALTPMGEERLGRLQPSTDAGKVAQLLAATSETTQFIVKNGSLPLRASNELPSILGSLAIEGRALEAVRLLALATFLESIEETRSTIRRVAGSFPLVEQAASGASSFNREVSQVREKIDATGEVVDNASPELKLIRERLRKQKSRLRGTL
jgi:DNA mismatch repair protein MutS2